MQPTDTDKKAPPAHRCVIAGGPVTHERLMERISERNPVIARLRSPERPECRGKPATMRKE